METHHLEARPLDLVESQPRKQETNALRFTGEEMPFLAGRGVSA